MYVVGTYWNCLFEAIVMGTHNIYSSEELQKNVKKLSNTLVTRNPALIHIIPSTKGHVAAQFIMNLYIGSIVVSNIRL